MALNPLYTFDQLPTTSAAAIREFDDRYIAAVASSQPTGWADTLGDLIPTNAPMVSFPISQLRTKYVRFEGEDKFKKLREASFDIKTEEFQDGYEAKLMDLFQKVYAYRNWQQVPARFVEAEAQFRHNSIAALLEAAVSTACYDGKNFFATDHPNNIGGTVAGPDGNTSWSNYQSSTKDVVSITNIEAEVTSMKDVRDENGQKMGVDPDTIIVPTAKVEKLRNLLAQSLLLHNFSATTNDTNAAGYTNPYQGRFKVVEARELTDVDDWFLADSKMIAKGFKPWAALRQTVPQSLALRWFDEASDFFKLTGNLKVSSHIHYGFGLALPHAVRLIKGA